MPGCDTFRDKATSKAASGYRTPGPSSSECKTVLKGRNHDGDREDPAIPDAALAVLWKLQHVMKHDEVPTHLEFAPLTYMAGYLAFVCDRTYRKCAAGGSEVSLKMAAPSTSGMAIGVRKFYGRSSKNKAEKIRNLLEEMPHGDDSDFGDLTDSDDEYVPGIGKGAMADPTVQENSDDSSEDEAEVTDTSSGTGSVDRGHRRKRLLECSLPVFSESSTEPLMVETPLAYFRSLLVHQ
ncbi:hypothetical protein HPB50_001027 [Hyalomma asiaticum]|uniref:Uncharacterized protein n=1 Tax=Hyalomma asiaticum TaxID=266040 RepID=A0ACB7RSE9_HYAAI|nr:hypothetical protein HPB50_001027 [Hyalomma asiaticum]